MDMMRIKRAADELGVTRQWVHKMVLAGKLTLYKIDDVQFIVRDDLFVERQKKIAARRKKLLNTYWQRAKRDDEREEDAHAASAA